jgi:hypothetical protein
MRLLKNRNTSSAVVAKHGVGTSTSSSFKRLRFSTMMSVLVATLVLLYMFRSTRLLNAVYRATSDLAIANTTTTTNQTKSAAQQPQRQDQAGACLITMDDNHWLVEWIAYHYFTMNLRYLSLAVDPSSLTSPQGIFDRWDGLIEFDFWNDDMIFHGINQTTHDSGKPGKARYDHHKDRQVIFYQKCLQAFQEKETVDWVSTIHVTLRLGAAKQ